MSAHGSRARTRARPRAHQYSAGCPLAATAAASCRANDQKLMGLY